MNIWKLWAESKDLNDDIVIYEVKELALLILCRNLQKQVYFAYVTQPNCYSSLPNNSPPISWLSGDKKLWCWHWCFPMKQWLNIGKSLPLPYLNLCLCFTTAVTVKSVIWKLLSLNYFMLFAFIGLYWFCQILSVIFLHWRKKFVRNADACVCFFNCNEIKVSWVLLRIFWLLL